MTQPTELQQTINVQQHQAIRKELDDFFESFTAEQVNKQLTDILFKALSSPETNRWDEITRSNKIFLIQRVIELTQSLQHSQNHTNSERTDF